jgi:hypothetical protein
MEQFKLSSGLALKRFKLKTQFVQFVFVMFVDWRQQWSRSGRT